MNFYKTSFILFVLSLPLVGLDCGKKDPEPVYYLPQEFKDYVVFPVGSYWVYVDGVQNLDTFLLYNQTNEIVKNSSSVPFTHEGLRQNYASSFYSVSLFGGLDAFDIDKGLFKYSQLFTSNIMSFCIPFFIGREQGYIYNYNEDISTSYDFNYDSLEVNGIWYKQVRKFSMVPEMDPRLPKRVWYARNIGVIKKELHNGQIWELKEYHIQ